MADDDRASVATVTKYTHIDQVQLVAGFAAGLLTGAALALLLAPATGRETRQWIATQGRAARHRTGQLLHTDQLAAVIRRCGVLGLADMLRRTDTDKRESGTAAPAARHEQA